AGSLLLENYNKMQARKRDEKEATGGNGTVAHLADQIYPGGLGALKRGMIKGADGFMNVFGGIENAMTPPDQRKMMAEAYEHGIGGDMGKKGARVIASGTTSIEEFNSIDTSDSLNSALKTGEEKAQETRREWGKQTLVGGIGKLLSPVTS